MNQIIWQNDGEGSINRARDIISALEKLKLPESFRIVDIACGNGKIISEIKQAFPNCEAYGNDILDFDWGKDVTFICAPLQEFIKNNKGFDVIIMLNSYRNWEGKEKDDFDVWLKQNTKYFITSLPWTNVETIGKDTWDTDMQLITI